VTVSRLDRAVELRSTSPAETFALGERLAAVAAPGDLVCLWGELGAGKTILAKGFGRGLGVTETINSPSFILMAEHPGRLRLFHLDLYRLADAVEVVAGGLLDERQADGVTVVEWPDRLGPTLPPERLDIRIDGVGDDPRSIRVETPSASMARYVWAATGAPT
jgi:tRNA threonylcarbamoyladenosine biosynthesis protein TsaE